MEFVQLESYKCTAEIAPVCVLNAKVGEVAARLSLTLHNWMEDGLGRHHGFILRVGERLVVRLRESLEKEDFGTEVEVDGAMLRSMGVESILELLMPCLGVRLDEIVWKTPAA